MAQHFLLSAAARTLSPKAIQRMSDEEAHYEVLRDPLVGQQGRAVVPALWLHPDLYLFR